MSFAAALAADPSTVATAPVGVTGIVYHLRPPGLAEVMMLPLGAQLIAEMRERAQRAQQLAHLDPETRAQVEAQVAPAAQPTLAAAITAAVETLPALRRLAVELVRGATTPLGEDWLCLTLDGVDGWPAEPEVERMPVESLSYDHLATIAAVATLGALGALRRSVWLPRRAG